MNKLAVVICYFGSWPRWMNVFVESCRYNPTVDFFLVTDCGPLPGAPSNIHVVESDLERFSALASQRLGIEVKVRDGYKTVDYKPTYGVMFEDMLAGYDFWGYGDLDLIYGDIRRFLTDQLLDSYDVVSTRSEFITGHFTLFRNTERMNRLFERSVSWAKILQRHDGIFGFDECGWGMHKKLILGARFGDIEPSPKIDSIMHVIMRSDDVRVHLRTIIEEQFDLSRRDWAKRRWLMRWERGRLFDEFTSREVMYFHFQAFKTHPAFYIPRWHEVPDTFTVTRKGLARVEREGLRARLADQLRRWSYYVTATLDLVRGSFRSLLRA